MHPLSRLTSLVRKDDSITLAFKASTKGTQVVLTPVLKHVDDNETDEVKRKLYAALAAPYVFEVPTGESIEDAIDQALDAIAAPRADLVASYDAYVTALAEAAKAAKDATAAKTKAAAKKMATTTASTTTKPSKVVKPSTAAITPPAAASAGATPVVAPAASAPVAAAQPEPPAAASAPQPKKQAGPARPDTTTVGDALDEAAAELSAKATAANPPVAEPPAADGAPQLGFPSLF